jgi:hypothetical protein
MATKQQALAAIWKDADERRRWYAGMAEAERRERAGERWSYGKGAWERPSKAQRESGRRLAALQKANRRDPHGQGGA